jgi:hypothetical protein
MATAKPTVQMNAHVEPRWRDTINRIANRYGWNRTHATCVAIRTLDRVLDKLEAAAQVGTDEQKALYRRVVREVPGDLMLVPPIHAAHVDDVPVIVMNGWLFWADRATGDLLAKELEGEERFCRVADHEVQLLVSPQEAALN